VPVQAILQVFVDESGRGQSSAAHVVAGFVASAETWLAFSEDWQAALDADPRLEYLKAREAMHKSGQFAGWSDGDRDRRIDAFLSVIHGHQLVPTRIAVPHKHYARIFKGKVHKKFDNPFWLPTYSVIMVTLRFLASREIDDKVDFVFDQVKPREEKLILSGWNFYRQYAARETKHLIGREPQFDDDRRALPLQAADLHAWHARQFSVACSRGHSYEHPAWRSLLSMGGAEREWTAADLKGVFDVIPRTLMDRQLTLKHLSRGA